VTRRKVLLVKENVFADLISEGAYVSRIKYYYGGILFDVTVENDDFIILNEETEDDFWESQESFEE
jgi:hypothetical protein